MLNRWAHVFLCILRLHSQFPPVGGSALTRPVPFGGPPRREGPGRGVVPVMLPAAWAPHPGARLPAAWWAFDRRYRPFLPYRPAPPYPCLSVRRPVSGTVRSSAAAVPHPISAFVRSQSPRGEAAGGTVCSCPTAPPRPISASACFVIPAVPSVLRRPPCPPDQCFRSVSFRRPLAVEDFDRRAKQVRTTLEIVVRGLWHASGWLDPSCLSIRSIDVHVSLVLRRAHAPAPPGG